MMKSMIRLAVLAPMLVAASAAPADVVYTNPKPDPAFPQSPGYFAVDLDGNGVDDFALAYHILPPNCPIPEGCPTWGESLASSLYPSSDAWMTTSRLADGEEVAQNRGDFTTETVVLFNYQDFQYSGPWVGEATAGSIGVCFPGQNGMRHYGWIRVVNREGRFDSFRLLDFAYQSTPNRAIIVGAMCEADRNADGRVDSEDFFLFLADFFSGSPGADVNGDAGVTSQDFFDFLTAFFAGC